MTQQGYYSLTTRNNSWCPVGIRFLCLMLKGGSPNFSLLGLLVVVLYFPLVMTPTLHIVVNCHPVTGNVLGAFLA